MIKLQLREVTNLKLLEAISEILKLHLPAKLSYRISKINQKLDQEAKLFDAERSKMLKKYCVLDDKGELVIKDNKAEFKSIEDSVELTKELNELLDVSIDCESLKLSDIENVKDLKGEIIAGLFPIIIED